MLAPGIVSYQNFNKNTVAGLTSWYDASDSLVPNTDGATLTQWTDKSDTANHLTTVNNTPKCYVNIQNGLRAAYFTGPASAASIVGANKADSNQPQTHFLVFKPTAWSTGTWQVIVDMQTDEQRIAKQTGTTKITCYAGTAHLVGDSVSDNTCSLITTIFNGASSSIQLNNNTAVTGNPGTRLNSNYPIVGAGPTNTESYTGYIMEWLVYDGALTTGQQTTVKNYLNSKWAVY